MTLDRLDTVIAFAVVMLAVSLIITIATQIISATLALRGSNLLWGLKTILNDMGIHSQEVDRIAREALTHTTISDSIFAWFKGRKLDYVTRRWRLATVIRPEELSRVLATIAANPTAFGVAAANATAITHGLN